MAQVSAGGCGGGHHLCCRYVFARRFTALHLICLTGACGLWTAGIPALMFAALYRNRHRLLNVDVRLRYGIIFEPYVEHFWFFELV